MKLSGKMIKNGTGFTLIEVLVGMTIFSLLLGAIVGVFATAVKLQRKSFAEQEIINQLSFATEYMSRALRMAKRDDRGSCLSSVGLSYENSGGRQSAVKFINHLENDECQEFFLERQQLMYRRGSKSPLPLTSPGLKIEDLRFKLSGASQSDQLQPRLTVSLTAKSGDSAHSLKLQTTVSQRNLDI
jgi:prepilin-type N-terminal cleavage/methylation domain-containing protein